MRRYALSTTMPASGEAVWAALVHLPDWPRWNRLVPVGRGLVAEGEELAFEIRKVDGGFRPHRPTVTVLDAPRRIVLAADFGHARLLRLEHTFEVVEDTGGCRLDQSWEATGLLVVPLWGMLTAVMARFAELGDDLAGWVGGPGVDTG